MTVLDSDCLTFLFVCLLVWIFFPSENSAKHKTQLGHSTTSQAKLRDDMTHWGRSHAVSAEYEAGTRGLRVNH